MTALDRPLPTPVGPLLPAGQRWGRGAASVTPYLRDALAMRPSNPVFTPRQFAELVWPKPRNRSAMPATASPQP
ncbi:MAG TPA: hypothetical protein VFE82_00270 [Ramlibacter sp.]|jgi:hypothetical protein|uniref:hypothetical protein n=1 Tax=Ramlibacter sp. TaxID=1917967 RepID=UPI002D6CF424|nr:hypothetical protein [Ramlibacter sp.]HZY16878.1 hypothetical protein [Ramlibacter sp.]